VVALGLAMLAVANPTSMSAGIPHTNKHTHVARATRTHESRTAPPLSRRPLPPTRTLERTPSEGLSCALRVPRVSAEYRFANMVRARVRSLPAKRARPTCSVHWLRARVRSATPPSSSPRHSIRGGVFRRGVRRGPGNFAGDPSVPSRQAHGAPPGQGPLHRTPATHAPTTNQQRRADAAPTHRPRTGTAVCTRARHTGVSTNDGRVFAHLLHRAERPALRHGPCRRYPPHAASRPYARTPMHMRALTGARTRRTNSRTNAASPSRARAPTHPRCCPLPSLLRPLFVADVGHDKLFCEEFCAGADVHAETHSRAVLGQAVRGRMSTRGRMRNTQSTVTGVPMGYS
jgi:hypothetical protein